MPTQNRARWRYALLLILVAVVVACLSVHIYAVRDSTGGWIFWNGDEALVFFEVGSSGAKLNLAEYVLGPSLLALEHVRLPDDKRCTQIGVIRVTTNGVQWYATDLARHAEEPYCFSHFVLFNGQIYTGALARADRTWRWSGTQFVRATPEDLHGFDPQKAAAYWEQFDKIEGWSMRRLRDGRYPLAFHGQGITLAYSGRSFATSEETLDVLRANQPPERIWSWSEQPRVVSRVEYYSLLAATPSQD